MNKELYVSSTPHETRLALAEDGEIAEVYYEREKEYSLAGSIYKGRVTRVLPGMQSAFVDIGLERDAFLYVSDFFEDSEEYDRVVSEAESAVAQLERPAAGPPEPSAAAEPPEAPAGGELRDDRRGRRGRHRGRRGRSGIPEEKFARPSDAGAPEPAALEENAPAPAAPAAAAAFVLPGESLAKYRHPLPPPQAKVEPAPAPARPAEKPPAPAPASAAAFVLPGESLAKYRHRQQTPEEPAIEPEAEPEVVTPPVLAEIEANGGEAEPDDAMAAAVAGIEAEEDQFQPDAPLAAGKGEEDETEEVAEAGEEFEAEDPGQEPGDSDDASAAVRAPEPEARLQAPARGDEERRRERRGGRRHRRRRGEGPATGAAAAPAEASAPAPVTREPREGKNESSRLISDLLHEGQEILVQIAKEPIGKKGARITSHLALPGRYLVYMPTVHHIGVSRRIASDEERARLKRIILEHTQELPGGFIVRTAGAGASEEELRADIRLLANLWNDLRTQFDSVRSPALLHHDLDLVERTLRDQLSKDFTHIWVDADEQFQRVSKFVSLFMPQLVDRLRLYTREEPMFEHFGVQEEINKALHSKVWLKSGGYIVINQTEALVAIDVNTGKYVGKSNRLEDTIVKTNVEAIREIVRQIRLRDLGGIIVIDFIDMDERKNRQKVLQALDEAMRADRAPSKVLAFNDFGLVALTRKRVKQSLERTLGSPCPYCEGVGLVKSPVTVCNEIYSEVKRLAPSIERDDLVLRVNPEIAKLLKAQSAQRLREMEDLVRKAISVRPDPQVHQERFEIY
ncbi:MAG: Rne/Rng family ribonuclease [Acidobacteria bacterium]|nr:MAG: Rne/Rng family ribonuclease [Acidobacteriota bacterium]